MFLSLCLLKLELSPWLFSEQSNEQRQHVFIVFISQTARQASINPARSCDAPNYLNCAFGYSTHSFFLGSQVGGFSSSKSHFPTR